MGKLKEVALAKLNASDKEKAAAGLDRQIKKDIISYQTEAMNAENALSDAQERLEYLESSVGTSAAEIIAQRRTVALFTQNVADIAALRDERF